MTNYFISQKMRTHFDACMDTDAIDKIGYEPALAGVENIGGWPVLKGDAWDESKFDLWSANPTLNRIGFSSGSFVSVWVSTDDKDSTKHVIHLDQPGFGTSRDFLVKGKGEKKVKAYLEYMQALAKAMGATGDYERELEEMLDFEIRLANVTTPKEERRDAEAKYNPTLLKDFASTEGQPKSWTKYVSDMIFTEEIGEEERVIVVDPKYFSKMGAVIASAEPRVLANYIAWRAIKSTASSLTEEARDIAQDYAEKVRGTKSLPPRWKTCIGAAGFGGYSGFLYGAGSMWAKYVFSKEAKDNLLDLIEGLRSSFSQLVTDADWMDEDTKVKALDKLSKMD